MFRPRGYTLRGRIGVKSPEWAFVRFWNIGDGDA